MSRCRGLKPNQSSTSMAGQQHWNMPVSISCVYVLKNQWVLEELHERFHILEYILWEGAQTSPCTSLTLPHPPESNGNYLHSQPKSTPFTYYMQCPLQMYFRKPTYWYDLAERWSNTRKKETISVVLKSRFLNIQHMQVLRYWCESHLNLVFNKVFFCIYRETEGNSIRLRFGYNTGYPRIKIT